MFSFNPFHSHSRSASNGSTHSLTRALTGGGEDKNLATLLQTDKKIAALWIQIADERRVASNQLKLFGRPLGDDLTDVTNKIGSLLAKWSDVMTSFASQYDQYRATMKSIAVHEAALTPSREKKRKLRDAIAKHEENHPGAVDKLMELKAQLAELEEKTAAEEVEMDNFKRMATREALYLLLNGMDEMAGKMDTIALFGKYIVDELDVTPVKVGEKRFPYRGMEQTARILKDANRAIDQWKPDRNKVRRTLTSHHGRNPLVTPATQDKDLPPAPPVALPPSSPKAAPQTKNETVEDTPLDGASTDDGPTNDASPKDTQEESAADQVVPERSIAVNEGDVGEGRETPTVEEPATSTPFVPNGEEVYHKPNEIDSDSSAAAEPPNERSPHLAPHLTMPLPQVPNYRPYPPQPQPQPQPPVAEPYVGGFAPFYLNVPDQQNLYQFYQHYAPPRPYDEMAYHLSQTSHYQYSPHTSPPGSMHSSPRLVGVGGRGEPGGFVMPAANPIFSRHQRSVSSSSASSIPTMPEPHKGPSSPELDHNQEDAKSVESRE